ncbi:hypothetical protein UFOVP128_15 [uncultured Caudovirales phage]|uniref:Uncharacterized protein n=1 Tax=uncultured Caudovirales phage TaxID=2100421 RepID=A0A6J7WWC6_9CAUD|nr:hypothetical protein UFOVP128_15 [uncultured Caudovirales phage]CAB5222060.1 hypothetical protein UFOVP243_29 [uncultured Caudovirales phage]
MSVTTASGVSATLVQPAIFRGAVAPSVASLGDLWEDTSGSVPVLKHCTTEPNTWTAISSSGGAYNPASVAITGGTIDGVPLGTTTPAAGTFTTLTAQTEVLKGTGQNLLLQSKSFTSNWLFASGTFTTNTAVDPLGTTTAATLTMSGATTANFYQSVIVANGIPYTWSIYAKAGTSSTIELVCYATGNVYQINCNLSSGTISSTSGTGTSTITSVGSGWYRITGAATATSSGTGYLQVNIIGNANTCFLWGAQLEIGSVANAFVTTTTTAVYGTPTLSFSGVAGIGLQSDGSLYVQPAGTGAIQAQKTDSTATGGNARGAYAVDWQTQRGSASRVASATNAFMGAGYDNAVSGGYSSVVGGYSNSATASQSAVLGGKSNISSGVSSVISGGVSNASAGYYNFIGGGYTNAGTANGAVTTQSGTMNGTTAVTLSGSNASIKVGQYITGTSIAAETYVAAVSGTSLTLSQAASGSSTSTLSFYTPHGVVVGGGNNQATGSYSFIGGGGDAGTASNRNVASGDWSFVGGGRNNTASGAGSVVGGGGYYSGIGSSNVGNTSAGDGSFVGGGFLNQAQSFGSSVLGGYTNTANGTYSVVLGSSFGTTRAIQGNTVSPASSNPMNIGSAGVCQTAILVLARQTTDATATVLASNSSAASGTNQVILPNNSAYYFKGTVVAGVTGGGNTKGWTVEGVIKRGANAASTALVGTPTVVSAYADAGAATWALTATADTTNGGLAITFTGQAATTIRCVAKIETTEMTY